MHIEKAKVGQVTGLIAHDERTCQNHTNEKIDPARHHLNYNLCEGNALGNYNKRMKEVYMRQNKSANALVLIANTLPKDFPKEKREDFFRYSHEFFCDFFGKENVISDWVHGDETSWHQHIKAIPTYFNEKKQRETVSFDKKMTRSVYKKMHKDLQKYLEEKMQMKVPILNGATAGGNRSIQELKAEELKKDNEKLLEDNQELKRQNQQLLQQNKSDQELNDQLKEEHLALQQKKENLVIANSMILNRRTELLEEIEEIKDDLDFLKNEQEYLKEYDIARTFLNRLSELFDEFKRKTTSFNFKTKISDFELELKQCMNNFINSIKKLVVYEDFNALEEDKRLSNKLMLDDQIKNSDDLKLTRHKNKERINVKKYENER